MLVGSTRFILRGIAVDPDRGGIEPNPELDLMRSFQSELQGLKGTVEQVADKQGEWEVYFERRDKETAELARRVNDIRSGATDDGPARWNWRGLTKAELEAAAGALVEWARWLTWRYGLTELPSCWWRHGAMVEELIALHAAHDGAYGLKAKPGDPLAWHDALGKWRMRLHEWDQRGCGGSRECRGTMSSTPGDNAIEHLVAGTKIPPEPPWRAKPARR